MRMIDACGLSCPEPVLKLKKVVDVEDEIELLVDNRASVENCSRFARSKGFGVSVGSGNGQYVITLIRE